MNNLDFRQSPWVGGGSRDKMMYMKLFSLFALASLSVFASAQLAISRNHVTLNPVVPGANNVYPVAANVLPSGQFATSSYIGGPTLAGSHFCAVNRTNGAFAWVRSGAMGTLYSTASGPGGRVGQAGHGIDSGYVSLAQGWNGVGSSLFSVQERALGGPRQEIVTRMAFDSAGNFYTVGYAYNFSSSAGSNTFVAKYNASGTRLWVRQSGLASLAQIDLPIGIGVDSVGDVWVAIQRGSQQTHVWKLNSTGTTLFGSVWQINGNITSPTWAGIVNNRFIVVGRTAGSEIYCRQYITTSNWVTATVGLDTPGFEVPTAAAGDSLGNIHIGYNRTNGGITRGAFRTVSRTNVVSPEAPFETSQEVTNLFVDSARNIYVVGWQPDMGGRMALVSRYSPTRVNRWSVSGPQLGFSPMSTAFHEPSGDVFVLQRNEIASPERMTAFFVSQSPEAVADWIAVTRNVTKTGNVRTNDRFWEDSMTVLVTPPTHGTLSLNTSGAYSYTPDTNYTGPDSFVYRLEKGGLVVSTATASITVAP